MIIIDYKDRRPIYEQVVERFEDLIIKGVLEPTSQIPSVRNLAIELSINPNTISRAYQELERKGLIYTVKGKGSFVTDSEHIADTKIIELLDNIKTISLELLSLGVKKKDIIKVIDEMDKEV